MSFIVITLGILVFRNPWNYSNFPQFLRILVLQTLEGCTTSLSSQAQRVHLGPYKRNEEGEYLENYKKSRNDFSDWGPSPDKKALRPRR